MEAQRLPRLLVVLLILGSSLFSLTPTSAYEENRWQQQQHRPSALGCDEASDSQLSPGQAHSLATQPATHEWPHQQDSKTAQTQDVVSTQQIFDDVKRDVTDDDEDECADDKADDDRSSPEVLTRQSQNILTTVKAASVKKERSVTGDFSTAPPMQNTSFLPTPSSGTRTRFTDTRYHSRITDRYRRAFAFHSPFTESHQPGNDIFSNPSLGSSNPFLESQSFTNITPHKDLSSDPVLDPLMIPTQQDQLDLLSAFRSDCQLQQYCDGSEWRSIPVTGVCTYSVGCSCENSCYADESCCLDKLLLDVRFELEEKTPLCHGTIFQVSEASDIGSAFFIMEDACPTKWTDQTVRQACINATGDDVSGWWPVQSTTSGVVYRNQHCARCNGETEEQLRQWDLRISCNKSIHLEPTGGFQDLVRQVMDLPNCLIRFESLDFSAQSCNPTTYYSKYSHACQANASFQNRSQLQMFEKACDAFMDSSPVTRIPTTATMLRALCDYRLTGETCGGQSIDVPFPFIMVMSIQSLQNVTATADHLPCRCASHEVYDPYEARCRRMECSQPKILHNGRCVHWLISNKGSAYQLHLRLTPADSSVQTIIQNIMFLVDIVWEVLRAFRQHVIVSSELLFDVFRMGFQMEKHVNNQSSMKTDDKIIIKRIDLDIKAVVFLSANISLVENTLIHLNHSIWNFSIDSHQDPTPFRVTTRNTLQREAEIDGYRFTPDDIIHFFYEDLEYWVDLVDHMVYQTRTASVPVVQRYNLVQETLICPKVSFRLTKGKKPLSINTNGLIPPGERKNDHSFISVSADTGEVILIVDRDTGSLYHHPSGRNISFQYVELLQEDVVMVCAEQLYETLTVSPAPLVLEKFFSAYIIYASVACQSLSVLCLFLVFFTYCLFAELRTLPGKNTMGLVGSLLLAMLLFEVGVARIEIPTVCLIVGVAIHFFLLSAFTWMVICSLCMYRIFTRLLLAHRPHHHHHLRAGSSVFAKHVAVSLLVPAAIVSLTLLGNWLTHDKGGCLLDLGYGRGICYLSNTWSLILASVLPICAAVATNLVLFLSTLRSLHSITRDVRLATRKEHRQLLVYIRMSTLTGINWLAGLMTAVIDSVIVWYIFIVLCGLQGLYVFIAFVCNERVLSLYRGLCGCAVGGVRRGKADDSCEQSQTSENMATCSGIHVVSVKPDID